MIKNTMKHFMIVGTLLLQGCSFFSAENQTSVERFPSSLTREVLQKDGLYPESLVGQNQLMGDQLQIYFNLPPYTNPGGVGLVPALLQHIKKSQKSIKLAIFQFNHAEVFVALKEAASRGVKIQISTDLCYSGKTGYKEYFDDLKSHLLSVGQSESQILDDGTPSCETMFNHNKYMIFDDQIAWFGSFNPTNHGAVENVELAISLKNPDAVKVLNLDFTQLITGTTKVKKKGVYTVADNNGERIEALDDSELKKLVASGARITYPIVKVGNHQFEFILSPKVKSLTRIVEEIYAANSEILFSSFAIADQMLISSIINKHAGRNVSPILLLPHPGENPDVIMRDNGGKNNKIFKTETEKNQFKTKIKNDLEYSLKSAKNYMTPKGEIKSVFRYFYPTDDSMVRRVYVEGIFNNKVIEAENTKDRLAEAGIPLYQSNMNGELHNKLFLIDENVTIFGSHNFSQSAENSNDELTVIVKSGEITKFLKNQLYKKTKYFSVPSSKDLSIPKIAITEIMSESQFQFKQLKRVVDAGDYIELYNFGDTAVNLFGMRIDDRFFPRLDGESMDLSTNPGFSGELVGFKPSSKAETLGTPLYDPKYTILGAKKTALIVGRYFNEAYYKEKFETKFSEINGRKPTKEEYPLLVTIGAHFSSVIGDSTTGLKSRDRISLYHIDNHTVIDRFEYPVVHTVSNKVVTRRLSQSRLQDLHLQKTQNSKEMSRRFYLKNGVEQFDHFYGLNQEYSQNSEWLLVDDKNDAPGIVQLGERKISSKDDEIVIEAEIADYESDTFKRATIVMQNGLIKDVFTSSPNRLLPSPILSGVVLFPGLIDGHNHLKYNFFPLWSTNKFFQNRYEWPELSTYTKGIKEIYKKVYTDIPECSSMIDEAQKVKCLAKERCHVLRFGEIKALLGGTTTIQGSTSFDETSGDITFRGVTPYYIGEGKKRGLSKARVLENELDACSLDAAQNLERISLDGSDNIRSTALPITSEAFGSHNLGTEKFKTSGANKLKSEYDNQSPFVANQPTSWKERTKAFYVHLGEGVDEMSRAEWTLLSKLGLAQSQSVVIHGLGFNEEELSQMQKSSTPLIWSPTSNALLYKSYAKIIAAKKNKLMMGLGSDWSLSGTRSMLYELKVAKKINQSKLQNVLSDHELIKMASLNNARIAGLDNYLGKIAPKASADFFIINTKHKLSKPSDTILALTESKIHSTWVKGLPQTAEVQVLRSLNDQMGLGLSVFEMAKLDKVSCASNMGFLTTNENINGLMRVVSRYKNAVNELSPKIKNDLNKEFFETDSFCHENENKALSEAFKALAI